MKKGLLIAVAMLLPMSLFGKTEMFGQNGELFIYTWGYGDTLAELLYAFKGFLDPKTGITNTMAKIALAFSIFFFAISKAVDSKVNPVLEFGRLLIIFAVINYMFLTASNKTYIVADQVNELHNKTVTGLPIGIGHTLSFMSVMEKILLEGFEQYYTTPQSSSYSKSGLGFTLSALVDVPTLRVGYFDTYLQKNMDKYVESCYSINATDIGNAARAVNLQDVAKSSNLVDVIFKTDDGKIVMQYKQGVDALGNPTADSVAELTTCGDAAQKIKTAFYDLAANKAEPYYYYKVLKQFSKDQQEATDKMEDTIKVFFPQAVSLRENLQQMMVMNALDDGIRNTAMALGLDGVSYTATTAVADQTITTAMQSQGRLAQTYLPLAKAYLTIIIVSIAWLMAILAILFNTFHHIKMFFTLCISMVLWTPILSIINFLNDLSLQKSFININANDAAFTYSNYASVIQAITANSNFLNYMVMLTPMLAFALAKGSEMGFVSIATSLSQQLAGASRAASSFATQQALSTKTAISSPRLDEVYAKEAGVSSHDYALSASGGRFKAQSIDDGGLTIRDVNTGTTASMGGDGGIQSAKIAGIDAKQNQIETITKQNAMSEQISNSVKSGNMREAVSNYATQEGVSSKDVDAISQTINNSLQTARKQALGFGVSETEFDRLFADGKIGAGIKIGKKGGKFHLELGGGAVGSTGTNQEEKADIRWGKDTISAINNAFTTSLSNSISDDKSIANAFSNAFKTHGGQESAEVASSIDSFTQAKAYSQAVSSDNMPRILENYIDRNQDSLGHLSREEQVATASKFFESAAARGDQKSILDYANMDTEKPNAGGLKEQDYQNLHNPNAVLGSYKRNLDEFNEKGGEKQLFKAGAKQSDTANTIAANDKAQRYEKSSLDRTVDAAANQAVKWNDDNLGENKRNDGNSIQVEYVNDPNKGNAPRSMFGMRPLNSPAPVLPTQPSVANNYTTLEMTLYNRNLSISLPTAEIRQGFNALSTARALQEK